MKAAAALLAVALALASLPAGAQVAKAPCAPPAAPDPMPEGAGHDHTDPSQHRFACRLDAVATLDLRDVIPEPMLFGEIDVAGTIAVIATAFPEAGFVVLDVSDPAKPLVLSRYRDARCETATDTDCGADVKLSSDGKRAFLALQRSFTAPGVPESRRMRPGIVTVSLDDPRRPRRIAFTDVPTVGVHMLAYHRIGGVPYVIARARALGPTRRDAGALILRIGDDGRLTRAGEVVTDTAHDVWLYDDPLDRKTYLYVSGAQGGRLTIHDVTDVSSPAQVGEWEPEPELPRNEWYIHNAWTFRVSGRRFTYVGAELYKEAGSLPAGHGGVAGPLWLVDTTDVARPKLAGEWRNPGNHKAGNLTFSPHHTVYAGGGVTWTSHYHGGVWVLDWNDVLAGKARRPREVGYHVPHQIRRAFVRSDAEQKFITAPDLLVRPMMWDITLDPRDPGVGYASDINGGFIVLRRAQETATASPSPAASPSASPAARPGSGGRILGFAILLIATAGALPLTALIKRKGRRGDPPPAG